MDIFERHYYRFNKRLLSMVGQWPYQGPRIRFFQTFFVTVIAASFIFVQLSVFVTSDDIFNVAVEVVPLILVATTGLTKMYTCFFNVKMMRELLDRMNEDWKIHADVPREIEIIKKYAHGGKMLTIFYAVVVYANVFLFFCVPIVPKVLDIVAPLNTPRPRTNPMVTEYFVDQEKYFYFIFCHTCFAGFIGLTMYVAADTMLMMYVQHACAMFAVACHRFENSIRTDESIAKDSLTPEEYAVKDSFVMCIETHRRAIQFADLIESTYTCSLLLQLVSNVVDMSVTLFRILTSLDDLKDALRYTGYVIAQLIHTFVGTYSGQILMDHSAQISDAVYNGKWCDLPADVQKFLLLVMRRGADPSYLTAGKICILSFTTFSTIVQTSVSYFMILCSLE